MRWSGSPAWTFVVNQHHSKAPASTFLPLALATESGLFKTPRAISAGGQMDQQRLGKYQELASKARRLAEGQTDEHTRASLRSVAEQYEELARRAQATS